MDLRWKIPRSIIGRHTTMAKNLIKVAVEHVVAYAQAHSAKMDEWRESDPETFYEYTFNQMEV